MEKRTNRRELIIQKAADLFMQLGYGPTTVRQIAEAAGVTEAALYYHFKEGKRALLQAVVECYLPDFLHALEACRAAGSLRELVLSFGENQTEAKTRAMHARLGWLAAEFPHLNLEEQALIDEKYIYFHQELSAAIQKFIPQESEAQELAWILISTHFGYGQIFYTLNLGSVFRFSWERFNQKLAEVICMGNQLPREDL